jgi:lysophospholipase L1-like esterase
MKVTLFFLLVSFNICFSTVVDAQSYNTLALGDSHGAVNTGWVVQLQKLRPNDKFCNLAIAGNTIGFNNGGQDTLNTIRNIKSYIFRAYNQLGTIDKILILLGTNDCKAVFSSRFDEITPNFQILLESIISEFGQDVIPQIIFISSPPIADDNRLADKYKGSNERLKKLIPLLKKTAELNHVKYIELNKKLKNKGNTMTTDGVHYTEEGYKLIARIINKELNKIYK